MFKYMVLEMFGQGTYGRVYKVKRREDEKIVVRLKNLLFLIVRTDVYLHRVLTPQTRPHDLLMSRC